MPTKEDLVNLIAEAGRVTTAALIETSNAATALMQPIHNDDIEALKLAPKEALLEFNQKGAIVAPLSTAAQHDAIECLNYLLEIGFDPNLCREEFWSPSSGQGHQRSPVQTAARFGSMRCFERLYDITKRRPGFDMHAAYVEMEAELLNKRLSARAADKMTTSVELTQTRSSRLP